MKGKSNYRPDIDGLRAVAVLAVVFYHLSVLLPGGILQRFSGGFVGVDVFFVISGYLITGLIQSRLAKATFSIAAFYEGRARRILPALFAVMAVSSFFAFNYMFPVELTDYARSLTAAVLSVSNVYFWMTSGYFEGPAESKLLLHTWSLAVEEQFYIVWPLLLIMLHRSFSGSEKVVVSAVGIGSFMLSAAGVFLWPEATFYLVFSRAWELALGASLALNLWRIPRARFPREVSSVAGLISIIVAMLGYTQATPFPGIAALLPCMGAAMIIASGEAGSSMTGKLLSSRPFVFLGLISYSLYLWHWPVFVLQRAISVLPGGDTGKMVKAEVLLLCLCLATLSWWFIERPFRRGALSRLTVFRWSALGGVALLIVAGVGLSGVPSRFTPEAVRMAQFLDDPATHPEFSNCQVPPGGTASDSFFLGCLQDAPSKPTILLLGDSHANHLSAGLLNALPKVNLLRLTASGCKPLPEGDSSGGSCGSLFRYFYDRILPKYRIDEIILAGRWTVGDLPSVAHFLDYTHDRSIPTLLFGPVMQYDQPLPRLIARGIQAHDSSIVEHHQLDIAPLDHAFADLARVKGIGYVSLLDAMCPHGVCLTKLPDGTPMQFDYGHLTPEGSRAIVDGLLRSGRLTLIDNHIIAGH
jgi:peptidoglycan/LPS O-acetylase OafA/YrhL